MKPREAPQIITSDTGRQLNEAFWKAVIQGALRQALSGVSLALVTKGYLEGWQYELMLTGAAGFLVSLGWSVLNKKRVREILGAALDSPKGTSYTAAKLAAKGE